MTAAMSYSPRQASCRRCVARLTSEPFSSVLITVAKCEPLDGGLARCILTVWDRWCPYMMDTLGSVPRARRYACWRAGCLGSCGRALIRAVKYLMLRMVFL